MELEGRKAPVSEHCRAAWSVSAAFQVMLFTSWFLCVIPWFLNSNLCCVLKAGAQGNEGSSFSLQVRAENLHCPHWGPPSGTWKWKLPHVGVKIITFWLGWNIPSLLAGCILVAVGTNPFNFLTSVYIQNCTAVCCVTKIALGVCVDQKAFCIALPFFSIALVHLQEGTFTRFAAHLQFPSTLVSNHRLKRNIQSFPSQAIPKIPDVGNSVEPFYPYALVLRPLLVSDPALLLFASLQTLHMSPCVSWPGFCSSWGSTSMECKSPSTHHLQQTPVTHPEVRLVPFATLQCWLELNLLFAVVLASFFAECCLTICSLGFVLPSGWDTLCSSQIASWLFQKIFPVFRVILKHNPVL